MEAKPALPNHTASKNKPIIDQGGDAHDPRLYETAVTAEKINGLDAITREHLDFYEQEGYLAVENAFSPEETEAAKQGLVDLILGENPDFKNIMFEAKAAAKLDTLSALERQDAVRKVMDFVDYEPRLKAISAHSKLIGILTRLLGEPVKMFQDMALIKPPRMGREKPWHQDKAYFDYPLERRVVGVWIALDPATVENGCMHVQPRGHKDGAVVHFKRRDWQICDTAIMGKPCVSVPLKPGGLLFFDGLLPHGTPTNFSEQRRKALQFHYIGVSAQKGSTEERLAVFGSEGRDVQC